MIALIIFLLCVFVALGVGVLSSLSDINGLKIPNIYSLIILGAFIACFASLAMLGKVDIFAPILSHIIAGFIMLVVTAVLFFTKMIGAADSKLATVYMIWIGLSGLPTFLFTMTFVGGFLGLLALYFQKATPFDSPKAGSWIAQVQAGESKVPYGIAIAAGAFAGFVKVGFLNPESFVSFIQ